MKLALAKLTRYGWNRRVLSEEDFYRICDKEGIEVIETPLVTAGFYMVFEEQPYIIINANLRGVRRLHVAFHELAHHLLHAPRSVGFYGLRKDHKSEREAEALALCALIPEPLLRRMLAEEIVEEYGYTWEMLRQRLKVLDEFGV
jgi:Zn-dependent peptidase ImmA (M78 family)